MHYIYLAAIIVSDFNYIRICNEQYSVLLFHL